LIAFTQDGLEAELRQGEILTGLIQYEFDPVKEEGVPKSQPYAMVVHQDCDLLQDFKKREANKNPVLNSILLVELHEAENIKLSMTPSESVWDQLMKNKQERWHFLSTSYFETEEKLPDLIADFRRIFTMPPSEVYRQIKDCNVKRKCRLCVPYREHLQSRFAYYLQRIALPDPAD
jgi:hypothetical protein